MRLAELGKEKIGEGKQLEKNTKSPLESTLKLSKKSLMSLSRSHKSRRRKGLKRKAFLPNKKVNKSNDNKNGKEGRNIMNLLVDERQKRSKKSKRSSCMASPIKSKNANLV